MYTSAFKAEPKVLANNYVFRRISTPTMIAYTGGSQRPAFLLPYYDEKLKDEIFGIGIGNLVICKDQFPDYWEKAEIMAQNCSVGHLEAALPSVEDLTMVKEYFFSRFNNAITILQDNDVDADCLDENGLYWTNDFDSNGCAVAFDLEHEQTHMFDKYNYRGCYCRLVWRLNA